MTKKILTFDDLIEESVKNIREDRTSADLLLLDLKNYMVGGPDRHKEVGLTFAKYLETLQRSNEQLVKIAALIKKENKDSSSLSSGERDILYKELQNKK